MVKPGALFECGSSILLRTYDHLMCKGDLNIRISPGDVVMCIAVVGCACDMSHSAHVAILMTPKGYAAEHLQDVDVYDGREFYAVSSLELKTLYNV